MRKLCAAAAWAFALSGMTAGCASTGATPRPFPMPGTPRPVTAVPPAGRPASGPLDTYALVGTALDLRGVRYRNGGADPGGFDCSGFTQYVFAQHGVSLPRSVVEQFEAGRPVRTEDLQEGDLVFFSTEAPGASHVGIAVGGDRFVHAPSTSGVVRVEQLGVRYWSQRFVGARRAY